MCCNLLRYGWQKSIIRVSIYGNHNRTFSCDTFNWCVGKHVSTASTYRLSHTVTPTSRIRWFPCSSRTIRSLSTILVLFMKRGRFAVHVIILLFQSDELNITRHQQMVGTDAEWVVVLTPAVCRIWSYHSAPLGLQTLLSIHRQKISPEFKWRDRTY